MGSTIILAKAACNNDCETGVENGVVEGKVQLAGTLNPVADVNVKLVKVESTGGFPSSTNYNTIDEAYTNSIGEFRFSMDNTGPFSDLDVMCYYDSELFWEARGGERGNIRQTDCGFAEDFILYPKAKLEVLIGAIQLPDNLSKGHIYNGKSDTSLVFTENNPPTGSITLEVVGNVSDTFYLRFDRWDTIYNAQYPDGYAYDVLDKLVKTPFRVDAWERGKFILNYP